MMKLVEVIRGDDTSQKTIEQSVALLHQLRKKPILVKKDVPGFVVNRILVRMMATARLLVQEGMASVEEIDACLKYGTGLPMGAFELLDYIGLDVHQCVERELEERGFAIPHGDLISSKVSRGDLGVKTGAGFYRYSKEHPRAAVQAELANKISPSLILSPPINEVTLLMSSSIASRDDIDAATTLGLNFPKGILGIADELGIDAVVENLERLKEKTHEAWLEPSQTLRDMLARSELGVKSGRGFYPCGDSIPNHK